MLVNLWWTGLVWPFQLPAYLMLCLLPKPPEQETVRSQEDILSPSWAFQGTSKGLLHPTSYDYAVFSHSAHLRVHRVKNLTISTEGLFTTAFCRGNAQLGCGGHPAQLCAFASSNNWLSPAIPLFCACRQLIVPLVYNFAAGLMTELSIGCLFFWLARL